MRALSPSRQWVVLRKVFVLGALTSAGIWTHHPLSEQLQTPKMRYPTKAIHLMSDQGDVLVEIIEVEAEGSPGRLDKYWCRVRNNTSKAITALAVAWAVEWSNGTIDEGHSQAMDARFGEGGTPLAPGDTHVFESLGPLVVEGAPIEVREVRVSVDYVEFDDGTSTGPDRMHASERIAWRRRGAEAYRQWLLHIYEERGKEGLIENLLHQSEEAALLHLTEAETDVSASPQTKRAHVFLKQGAHMFRQRLLSFYKKQGIEAVMEKLVKELKPER
jgi:hypothetical protein